MSSSLGAFKLYDLNASLTTHQFYCLAATITAPRVEAYHVCNLCNKKGQSVMDGRTGEMSFRCMLGTTCEGEGGMHMSGFVKVKLDFGEQRTPQGLLG